MTIIFNFSMVQKIDEFYKKAEKLFETIEGEATADVDSDYLFINFICIDSEFISSKIYTKFICFQKETQKTKFAWSQIFS